MESKKILQATLVAALLALGGCAGDTTKPAEPQVSEAEMAASEAIAAAKAALDTAVKGGFAWRDTGKMIKQAEELAAKGDYAKATKLAKEAEIQSELAAKQAKNQRFAGPTF